VPFHIVGSGAAAKWQLHGVPLLTYVLCLEETSDVLRRVALRRPDIVSPPTCASPTATSAATSDVGGSNVLAVPRAALLWCSSFVYVDQVSGVHA
jgi:hypothetical protein